MKVEGPHPPKTSQTGFDKAPESFNSIDMGRTRYKLVFPMIHPKVFPIPDVDQAMIASPAVGSDDALQGHLSANDALKSVFGAIRNDLGIDFSVPFEKAKNNGLSKSSSTPFSFGPSGPEERFIHFDLSGQGRLRFTVLGNPFPKSFHPKTEIDFVCAPQMRGEVLLPSRL